MEDDEIILPVYSQIALDIARRIARGELKEQAKIHGRSVMASEYGVSPETIRRAMRLLDDMQIIEVKEKSGAVVLSVSKAVQYVERFGSQSNIRAIQKKLTDLVDQQQALNRQIVEIAGAIVRINERFSSSNPFTNYEIDIPPGSPVVGRTLSELKFWQATRATVIAIRREDKIILSPGPYITLQAGDTIIFVGDITSSEAVSSFIH